MSERRANTGRKELRNMPALRRLRKPPIAVRTDGYRQFGVVRSHGAQVVEESMQKWRHLLTEEPDAPS